MGQIFEKQTYYIVTIFLFALFLQAKSFGLKKEKLSTHLHFYSHDIMSGTHPTLFRVADAAITNTSKTRFGSTFIIDDPLTTGPELTSKLFGKAQGIVASSDLSVTGFLFVVNFVFTNDKYNGSSLSVLGRNEANLPVREMPVLGGTGLFRFARGYLLTKTQFYNASSGDATLEYDVYVHHY